MVRHPYNCPYSYRTTHQYRVSTFVSREAREAGEDSEAAREEDQSEKEEEAQEEEEEEEQE